MARTPARVPESRVAFIVFLVLSLSGSMPAARGRTFPDSISDGMVLHIVPFEISFTVGQKLLHAPALASASEQHMHRTCKRRCSHARQQ